MKAKTWALLNCIALVGGTIAVNTKKQLSTTKSSGLLKCAKNTKYYPH